MTSSADRAPRLLVYGVFGPGPESAGLARRMVREALASWDLPELRDDVELVTGELAANALLGGVYQVTVSFEITTNSVHLSVQDGRPGEPLLKEAGEEDENGRGLVIVEALADEWGVAENGGVVWARFTA